MDNPEGRLEETFIAEFLRARGYDSERLGRLPDEDRKRLLRDASIYAAGKLTELEARAHFVQELHGTAAE